MRFIISPLYPPACVVINPLWLGGPACTHACCFADFEKNQLSYLRADLPYSWVFPEHLCCQNRNPSTFEHHVSLRETPKWCCPTRQAHDHGCIDVWLLTPVDFFSSNSMGIFAHGAMSMFHVDVACWDKSSTYLISTRPSSARRIDVRGIGLRTSAPLS